MACCTNTYDLGCHSQCDLLELADLQWASTGDFCFFFSFAGNTYTWETEGVEGYSVELSMQYLNEDGSTTFQIKNSSGVIQTFEIDGTEYDCFKISSIPAGCGTSDLTTAPQTCSSPSVGVEGDLLVWDYSEQQYIRLPAGPSGEVLTSNGAGTMPTYEAGGGGGGSVADADNGLGLNGDTVELGINDLNRDTPLWAAGFNLLFGGIPEANKQWEYDSGPDLFKLNAHHGLPAINGIGFRYMLTFDGTPIPGYPLGKPTSWIGAKASNDTGVGGTFLASLFYFNVLTFEETYFEATEDLVRFVTTDGTDTSSVVLDRATETLKAAIAGVDKLQIDSAGITNIGLSGSGLRLTAHDNNGLETPVTLGSNLSFAGSTLNAAGGGTSQLLDIYHTFPTIVSAVGIGYSLATPNFFSNYITIPGGTVQAGDYLIVRSGGQRSGSGNAAFYTSIANIFDASTGNFGSHAANFGSYVGMNFMIYFGAAGTYLMPNAGSPAAVPPPDEFNLGGAGSSVTGHTQVESGITINYANPIYIQNWAIAANTSTVYSKYILVEHYRP